MTTRIQLADWGRFERDFGSNEEIRKITHFDRNQAHRLMVELMKENPELEKQGERRWARHAMPK